MRKLWNIYRTSQVGGEQFGHYLCSVETEDASTATGIASAGTMTSRLDLVAYPDEIDGRKSEWPDWAPRLISLDERKPGRPVEREGTYQRITLEVRSDLLKKIDASGKSRREYIEQLLERKPQPMQYDSRDGNYHGILPNGDEIIVDGDVYAEQEQEGVSEQDLSSPLVWENNADGESVRIVKRIVKK